MRLFLAWLSVLSATLTASVQAQAKRFADLAEITVKLEPSAAKIGDTVTLSVTVTPQPGNWTYAIAQPKGEGANGKFAVKLEGVQFSKPVDPPGWVEEFDTGAGEAYRKYKQTVTWDVKGQVVGPIGKVALSWKGSSLQACNKKNCYNATPMDYPNVELDILPGVAPLPTVMANPPSSFVLPPPKVTEEVPSGATKKALLGISEYEAKLNTLAANLEGTEVRRVGGLGTLLMTAVFWGLISLITPCVFPMIPITISLFLKQSNQSAVGAVKLASIYCATIIVVLGLSAVSLLSVFAKLSVHPYTNIALGLLMAVFALSLFGLYNLTLPQGLLKFTDGQRKQGGLLGTVFGAIAFSIVSFTCVAPFLGGFAGMTASGQYSQLELVAAGIAFATAFAAPFFILALFPSLLKKLPKSGGWLDVVKSVMGFLELAAALKFFRTAELRLLAQPTYFTYDFCLAGFIAIALLCGLYLLSVYRLPHDEEKGNIGVVRMLFAMGFIGLAIYLTPGLFKTANAMSQRSNGVVFNWVDAFLLPEAAEASNGTQELPWGTDLPDAIKSASEDAARSGKPKYVFIDFTGVTCSNCKANERSVFSKPEVKELFRKYQLVQMYTDDVPEAFYLSAPTLEQRQAEGAANLKFQNAAFKTQQLPLYVILEPTSTGAKQVAVYDEGKINNLDAFLAFLKAPYEKTP